MTHHPRPVAVIVAAALTAALGSACTSGSTDRSAPSPTVTTTVTTTAPTSPAPSGSGPTSSSSGPTPSGSGSTPPSGGSPTGHSTPICTTAHLTLTRGEHQGAAGTDHTQWLLTNTAGVTCSMTGYVGFSGLDARGAILGRPAERLADLTPNGAPPSGPQTVTLLPNARVQFLVAATNQVPSPGCPTEQTATAAQVYPPGQTTVVRATVSFSVCHLQVGPLRPLS